MPQSTMRRMANTAVGIPVTAVNALIERLTDARQTLEASAEKLPTPGREDIDRWAREGKEIVDRMMRRIRRAGPDAATTLRDTMQGLAATTPANDVADIPGIGEAYSERMRKEGVTTVAAFLARTDDDESLTRFAEATSIAPGRIRSWRARVDLKAIAGIDEAYDALLREAGYATVAAVASADPETLSDRIAVQRPDRMPSRSTIEGWIGAAHALER